MAYFEMSKSQYPSFNIFLLLTIFNLFLKNGPSMTNVWNSPYSPHESIELLKSCKSLTNFSSIFRPSHSLPNKSALALTIIASNPACVKSVHL